MKKIIAFANEGGLEGYYERLIDEGAERTSEKVTSLGGELRRVQLKTKDGHELELVYINVHLGDLLLWNREAGEIDISRVLEEIKAVKDRLNQRVHTLQAKYKKNMEVGRG
jgi:hypothetical protein